MSSQTTPSGNGPAKPANPGDVGRRLAQRRKQLGLTREQAAARAGVAPEYLQYLEEHPGDPSTASLLRLAGALDTTVSKLLGGGLDVPPGRGQAGHRPLLEEMGTEESWSRLGTHGVGRVAVITEAGPAIVPVNYSVIDDTIVFRTARRALPGQAAGEEVAFEVDNIDEVLRQGWSVLAVGRAEWVTDPREVAELGKRAYSLPWAGGVRDEWVRITPSRITGRRIRSMGQ